MVGEELRRIRRGKLDLSQQALGEKLGRSARQISDYEHNRFPIPIAVELALHHLTAIKN